MDSDHSTFRTLEMKELGQVSSENLSYASSAAFKPLTSLMSGGIAGIAVDVILFPLDTIKTQLQSKSGLTISFLRSGSIFPILQKVYRGMITTLIGSAPSSALFFVTYDGLKGLLLSRTPNSDQKQSYFDSTFLCSIVAGIFGEINACFIRVPTEVIKQNMQKGNYATLGEAVQNIYLKHGIRKGFYRGYLSTLFREIPFTCIQFPLYEYFKYLYHSSGQSDSPFTYAIFGSIAGSIAAALTTPLDVVKTRIMLRENSRASASRSYYFFWQSPIGVMREIYLSEGLLKGLFRGVVPRTTWIGIGGLIYFGVYEKIKSTILNKES